MRDFLPYVHRLENLLLPQPTNGDSVWREQVYTCLNGEPRRELRRLVAQSCLRETGAFFTGPRLAKLVSQRVVRPTDIEEGVYFDPSCGAGDLLVAVAQELPLESSVSATLQNWSKRFAGLDCSSEFVRTAKARLALLAAHRHGHYCFDQHVEAAKIFPLITVGNALTSRKLYLTSDYIVTNPPFSLVDAPPNCSWAQGKVNSAAIFLETALRRTKPGTKIVAILPDVLRSGTRYLSWRALVESLASVDQIKCEGVFDPWADVTVFIATFTVGTRKPSRSSHKWTPHIFRSLDTVGSRFSVHVGSVVPHRHAEIGPSRRFIQARTIPPWGVRIGIWDRRRFKGRVFAPPFVAVRRTSRPDDRKRAVPTIVLGREPVAVENHLLVLLPRDGTLDVCQKLVSVLASDRTDSWLNKRIRCRHLTVSALSEMPWWEGTES